MPKRRIFHKPSLGSKHQDHSYYCSDIIKGKRSKGKKCDETQGDAKIHDSQNNDVNCEISTEILSIDDVPTVTETDCNMISDFCDQSKKDKCGRKEVKGNVEVSSNTKANTLGPKLVSWASSCSIKHSDLTKLLKILKEEGHPQIPSDARTLLSTPTLTAFNHIKLISNGKYSGEHINRKNQLNRNKVNFVNNENNNVTNSNTIIQLYVPNIHY